MPLIWNSRAIWYNSVPPFRGLAFRKHFLFTWPHLWRQWYWPTFSRISLRVVSWEKDKASVNPSIFRFYHPFWNQWLLLQAGWTEASMDLGYGEGTPPPWDAICHTVSIPQAQNLAEQSSPAPAWAATLTECITSYIVVPQNWKRSLHLNFLSVIVWEGNVDLNLRHAAGIWADLGCFLLTSWHNSFWERITWHCQRVIDCICNRMEKLGLWCFLQLVKETSQSH